MEQHTPGPWIIGEGKFADQVFFTPVPEGDDWGENLICETGGNNANARLIAAAPDLLKVAEYTLNHFTATDNPTPDQLMAREVQLTDAARLAIAKATQ